MPCRRHTGSCERTETVYQENRGYGATILVLGAVGEVDTNAPSEKNRDIIIQMWNSYNVSSPNSTNTTMNDLASVPSIDSGSQKPLVTQWREVKTRETL